MSKIKINKNDHARILLTELLPYEVPMLFSNEGFYTLIQNGDYDYFFKKINVLAQFTGYGIPFDYHIFRNNKDSRRLSIIHPSNQYNFIDFYKKYDLLIVNLCDKSPFSLRHPSRVAKYQYSSVGLLNEDEHKTSEVETDNEVLSNETRLLKSYFTYKKYDLIYKFYENFEFQRLEQRFDKLLEFDVHKCFYNIYTHSVTWAVKGKEISKQNGRKESFENSFDKLMQQANYNETNGIVVGPEVSRIFSEVIFQQIDLNVLRKLDDLNDKLSGGFKFGVNYEIRRYVDDILVFSNDEKVLHAVLDIYQKELEVYKLYVNSSKTHIRQSPFITSIAIAKHSVNKILNELSLHIIETVEITLNGDVKKEKKIKKFKPYAVSREFIKNLQCVVKTHDLSYDIVSKDIIRYLKKVLVSTLKDLNIYKENLPLENFLTLIVDISFYAYSLGISVSSTYKISQIIVVICKYLENDPNEALKHSVYSKISREAEFVMTSFKNKLNSIDTNIETLNLLIALRKLVGKNYMISEKKIKELFSLESDSLDDICKNLNYFKIITLLYYINNDNNYTDLREKISNAVLFKFSLEINPYSKAEYVCLFFDFICCPFIDKKHKVKLMRNTNYVKNNTSAIDIDVEIDLISKKKLWFMNWSQDIDLEFVLKKKEWTPSY